MKNKTDLARGLRRRQTEAESLLWKHLRSRQLCSSKFRRQVPIGEYIVDFVCFERRLVIEVDGGQHIEQENYDKKREKYLKGQGFKVLRFWNTEIFYNKEGVLEVIKEVLNGSPSPQSSPVKGEES